MTTARAAATTVRPTSPDATCAARSACVGDPWATRFDTGFAMPPDGLPPPRETRIMTEASWTQIVTTLYLIGNGFRLCAYLPQIDCLIRRRDVDGISVASWLAFAAANATTVVYAVHLHSGPLLVTCNVANLAASLLVALLAALCRGRRSDAVAGGRFYSVDHAAASSGGHRMRRGRRIDAAFLDAVARYPRRAVQFQFRPFDPAAGVGERAARMEGAA